MICIAQALKSKIWKLKLIKGEHSTVNQILSEHYIKQPLLRYMFKKAAHTVTINYLIIEWKHTKLKSTDRWFYSEKQMIMIKICKSIT